MSEPSRLKRLRLDGDDLRLALTCFAGGVLLALMTGPEGNITDPTYSFRNALFSSHVWGFLIFGVLLAMASVYRRKVRMGVVSRNRETPRRTIRVTMTSVIASPSWPLRVATAVVALLAALLIADFTGPFVAHKFSVHVMLHQLVYTRTYGYVFIIFWLLNTVRVNLTPRSNRGVPSILTTTSAKLVAGAVGGFFFALCADSWLPPRFSFAYFTFTGNSDRAFLSHWTTYLWMLAGLFVGLRAVRAERTKSKMDLVSRWKRPHVKVTADTRFALYGAALFVAVEAPKFLSPFWQQSLFTQIGIYCLLAVGLNVVVGFAGLLDLGYVAFYALGAYTNAYFTGALPIHPPFLLNAFFSIPIAILVCMIAGVILGLPTLRLRGDYLAIVTLGFGEIVYVLASNLNNVTDGAGGTGTSGSFSMHIFGIHWALAGQAIGDDLNFYYLLLAFLVPIIFLFYSLNNSKVGRSWAAIREDEVAAASLGINSLKYKVMAFAIGASTSGVGGVLASAKLGALFPSDFALQVSILVLVLVIFGGMGSIMGVLIGAAFVGWFTQFLIFHSFIDYQDADKFMYLGAILILTMIFRPQGMLPSKRRLREFHDSEAGLGSADAMGAAAEGPLS
ncbi:MAG TPA: branched-chain amino acid ABC transporter permease [Acidimicrobiales bacterium]